MSQEPLDNESILDDYEIYQQDSLMSHQEIYGTLALGYLLGRFEEHLYNVIFRVVEWASTPEELSEGFLNCAMTHQDWIMLILFFEDQERPDEAELCLQTAQKMLA